MASLDLPKSFSHLFIHRKNKDYIKANIFEDNNEIKYSIYKSTDGFHYELTSESIFYPNFLPKPTQDILSSTINLYKFIKKNGYKVCTTITQTKNGVKLK